MARQADRRPIDPERVVQARARLPGSQLLPVLQRLQKAVCDDARARIIAALRAGPLAVDDIALVIGREPPATSQHLRILRDLGVVEGERRSSRVYYRLRPGRPTDQAVRVLTELERDA
jgi:DNA-binding transcriptional ArsR family regulator